MNKLQLVLINVLNRSISEHFTRQCTDAFKVWWDF